MPRPVRRALTPALVLAAVALALMVPWALLAIQSSTALRRELDRLRAEGAPLTLAEAAPKPVPPDQNAMELYLKAFAMKDPAAQDVLKGLDGAGEYLSAGCVSEARDLLQGRQARRALDLLRQGAQRPHCVLPGAWTTSGTPVLQHSRKFRMAARVLSAKARVCALDGRSAEALEWLAVSVRMADHQSRAPSTMAQLVATAMLSLDTGSAQAVMDNSTVDPSNAAPLLAALGRLDLMATYRRALIAGRAEWLDLFAQTANRPSDMAGIISGYPPPLFLKCQGALPPALGRPCWAAEEVHSLEAFDLLVDESNLPFRAGGKPRRTDHRFRGQPGRYAAAAVEYLGQAEAASRDRAIAYADLMRTALLLKLYRRQHGAYPTRLAALCAKRPMDVFSGKDFGYRLQGKGFVLYSIGDDLKDDGGKDYRDLVWASTQ
jgi:hypothetical protein